MAACTVAWFACEASETGNVRPSGAGNAADDRARGLLRSELISQHIIKVIEGEGIEEGLEQPQLRLTTDEAEIGVIAVHRLGQHRVPEAIHGLREFENDRGVDVGVNTLEVVLQAGERGRELVEHDAVVLHLRAEPGGLEHALAVPVEVQCINGQMRRRLARPRSIGDRERQGERGGKRS